jgi:hypothetical protein
MEYKLSAVTGNVLTVEDSRSPFEDKRPRIAIVKNDARRSGKDRGLFEIREVAWLAAWQKDDVI